MTRSSFVALLASVPLAALCWTNEGFARGGGHFGGDRFGGARFEGRPELRAPEREFRPEENRLDEMRRPEEEHRLDEDAVRPRDDTAHPAGEEPAQHRDATPRDLDARRDLANPDKDFRNAIGNGHWDHNQFWNQRFGAGDFNCWGGCRYGWAGRVFWPFAYGDIFSFAWWPYAGVPAFWNYGLNTILTGLFWPYGAYEWPDGYGAYAWSGGDNSYQYAREAHQDIYSAGPAHEGAETQTAASAGSIAEAGTCSGFAPGVTSLPMDRIEQALKPEQSQRAVFGELEAASAKAEAILKDACPSDPPLTPVGRLDALEKRLEAMDQAVDTVMAPLAKFSSVLTDEQRRELDAMGGSGKGANGSALEMGDVGDCIDQGQLFTDVPAQQIEQAVRPDERQRAALDALKNASAQAAERLRSGCPTSIPAMPEARLEAMDKRLHETIVAVNEVRPALVGFYDSLSDEQKARFNTLPSEQVGERP